VPYITVEWFEGRSAEQKAELARRITEAMTEVAGTPAEEVWIRFEDAARADWAMGGELKG
jgi:4-oxalocrotonate tautomerase